MLKQTSLTLLYLLSLLCCNGSSGAAVQRDGGAVTQRANGTAPPDASAAVARCRERTCLVRSGSFLAGSPVTEPFRGQNSEAQRQITFTHSLLVDRFEVSQADWSAAGFINAAGSSDNGQGGRDCVDPSCPAAMLTWFDAVAYASQRSRQEGLSECITVSECVGEPGNGLTCQRYQQTTSSYYECDGYRLPTNDEFEMLVRGGTQTAFYTGDFDTPSNGCYHLDHLDSTAWYCNNSSNKTHPVGQLQPNPWGLFDMMGNAAEFTATSPVSDVRQHSEPVVDPNSRLFDDGLFEVRGGFYFAWPTLLRSANQGGMIAVRQPLGPATRGPGLGFRLVRSISPREEATW